jgi:hypothetical protein
MLVTAVNRTNEPVLVGAYFLLPGEGRRVTLGDYIQARAVHGAGLDSADAPAAAVVLAEPELDADLETAADEPDEYSLDVLDGDVGERDLWAMTRAELAELARTHGLVPGRRTKRELIEALHEYAD